MVLPIVPKRSTVTERQTVCKYELFGHRALRDRRTDIISTSIEVCGTMEIIEEIPAMSKLLQPRHGHIIVQTVRGIPEVLQLTLIGLR